MHQLSGQLCSLFWVTIRIHSVMEMFVYLYVARSCRMNVAKDCTTSIVQAAQLLQLTLRSTTSIPFSLMFLCKGVGGLLKMLENMHGMLGHSCWQNEPFRRMYPNGSREVKLANGNQLNLIKLSLRHWHWHDNFGAQLPFLSCLFQLRTPHSALVFCFLPIFCLLAKAEWMKIYDNFRCLSNLATSFQCF